MASQLAEAGVGTIQVLTLKEAINAMSCMKKLPLCGDSLRPRGPSGVILVRDEAPADWEVLEKLKACRYSLGANG